MSEPRSFEQLQQLYRPAPGPVGALPPAVEVLIIGAGPIGLTAAATLGRSGVSVLLIEQNAATSDQPKAIMIDDEYLRLLDRIGLSADLREHLTAPVGVHFISPLGFVLAKVGGGITPNGFGGRCAMAQPVFEQVLLAGALRWPSVTVRFRCRALELSQDDVVRVTFTDHTGTTRTVAASYVLACDGARSFARKRLGVEFSGRQFDQPHLVVDLAEFPDQVPFIRFFCNPRRPAISVPAPYGGRRLEFMLLPGDDRERLVSAEGVRQLCRESTPYRELELKPLRLAVYDFSERICARMRAGRVFLLGDAAHIMPPFGGQGMNAGGRDVANLSWKLEAVLRGRAAAAVLDSYETERRQHIRVTLAATVREGRLINLRSWPLALLRDGLFALGNLSPRFRRYFTQMRFTPKPCYDSGIVIEPGADRTGLVGRIFPRPSLRAPDGTALAFDELMGTGFALVGIEVGPKQLCELGEHPLWRRLKPALFALSLGLKPPEALAGVICAAVGEGPARGMLGSAGGHIAILRPDRYTAAAAPAAGLPAASDALARLLQV